MNPTRSAPGPGSGPDHEPASNPTAKPPDTLFRSRDLLVRRAGGFAGGACVVTFDSFSDRPTLDRPGFAEHFLRSRGIDAIHVISRVNAWYQHPETLAAMAAIRAATAPYARVVTYGSSMGGYAALRLAGSVGARVALAMSPQFSVLPDRVPFEYRWTAPSGHMRDAWETALPLPDLAEPYVLFDPLNLDAEHAARLARGMRIVPVRLRGAGHQVAAYLQEIGVLERVVLEACRGPLDVAALEQEAWSRRRRSSQATLALAARARSPARRIGLLRGAQALAPHSAPVMLQLGIALSAAGRFAEALDVHRAALAIDPADPQLLVGHALTLAAAGEVAAALAVAAPLSGTMEPATFAALHARLAVAGRVPRPGRTAPHDPGPHPPPGAAPVRTALGQAGTVLFGPYLELRPGRYAVEFAVRLGPGVQRRWHDRRTACILDVTIHGSRTILARRKLSTTALRAAGGQVTITFDMPEWTTCEFRVRATGTAALVVEQHRPVRRAGLPGSGDGARNA